MKLTTSSTFILGLFVMLVLFWFSASLFDIGTSKLTFLTAFSGFAHTTQYGYIFSLLYGFIPLLGGILGLNIAKRWGNFKSSMGRAIIFLSISLLFWALGSLAWAYYNFILHTGVPYPALSDVGWVLSYPFWALSVIFFGQATGIKFGLRHMTGKLYLIVVPIAILILSWYVLVILGRGGSITSGGGGLTVFFDIAYPVGDVIILTMAALIYGLSFKLLGGQYKWPIVFVLLGFLVEYIADFGFSYTTTINTYYNGSWVDMAYALSLFLMAFGLTLLDTRYAV